MKNKDRQKKKSIYFHLAVVIVFLLISFQSTNRYVIAEDCTYNADCPNDQDCINGNCASDKLTTLRKQVVQSTPTPSPTSTPPTSTLSPCTCNGIQGYLPTATGCDPTYQGTLNSNCSEGTPCCLTSPPPTVNVLPARPISPLDAAFLAQSGNSSCPMPADILVKIDGTEKSIFTGGATIETIPTSCPYLSPLPVEPVNIVKNVSVSDLNGDCAQCPSYVRDLIYKYYDGDLLAGNSLCSLPPDQLKNCVVLVERDEISLAGSGNNPVKKSHVKNKSSDSGLLKNMKSQIFNPITPWLVWGITNVLSPILDAINRQIYDTQAYTTLTFKERDSLLNRWPEVTNTNYYAATRQHWFAYAGLAPQEITLDYRTNPTTLVRVHYIIRPDILSAIISPAQALADFQGAGNFFPDWRNSDGRRTSGTLDYELRARDVSGTIISKTQYKPFYHANFIDPFPLFLFARLINSNNNLSTAFNNLYINWNVDRYRDLAVPILGGGQTSPPLQDPHSSWAVVPPMPNPAPQVIRRFVVVIQGINLQGTDAARAVERFHTNNTSAYIQNIVRNQLNYPAGNFAIYNVNGDTLPNLAAFQTKINATVTTARTIRTNNPNAWIELVFYLQGHGRSVITEPVINGQQPIDRAWFKDGGCVHEFWLGGNNSLLESTLKDFANGFVKSNANANVNNRIFDRIDFVDGSCESGAGNY